jgi:glycosyltransferase involved in cell wall biosynthesis
MLGGRLVPLRVLLVAPIPPPSSGIGTWAVGLLKSASQDPDVTIVHVDSAVRFRSIGNLTLQVRLIGGTCHGVVLLGRLIKTLMFKRIDVIHVCTSGSLGTIRDIVFVVFARLFRVPAVVHMHFGRLPVIAASRDWEQILIKTICKLSKYVIVLDRPSCEAVRALVPGCSVSAVANPAWKIDRTMPGPVTPGATPIVCFAGHLIPTKGVRELVRACRDIEGTEFRLELTGPVEDGFREELHGIANMRNEGEWFKIFDPVGNDEVFARMARAAMVVLPSYTEGFPNVILEAMMLGKGVVATPVGAIPEILSFGSTEPCGICVPVGDVDALRIAIETLLKQPNYAQELGRRARVRVEEEYSPVVIYQQYKSIWLYSRLKCAAGDETKSG